MNRALSITIGVFLVLGGPLPFVVADDSSVKLLIADIEQTGGHVYFDKNDKARVVEVHLAKVTPDFGEFILAHKKHLRKLTLVDVSVRDQDLRFVGSLPELQILSIDDAPGVTDKFMKQLSALPNLRELWLVGCGVKGDGIDALQGLRRLRVLDLSSNPIDGSKLLSIASLEALQQLNLGKTGVTDAEMEPITKLKNLRTLNLSSTSISDRGLTKLHALRMLTNIFISSPPISAGAIADFETALPTIRIFPEKQRGHSQ